MNEDALVIPLEELTQRRDLILERMREAAIDLAVFTSAPGVYYLTGIEFGGFATRHALLLRSDGTSVLLVREIEHGWREAVRDLTWVGEWAFYPDTGDWADTLIETAGRMQSQSGRVAAELSRPSLTAAEAGRLAGLTLVTELVDVAPLIESQRAVKSDLEVTLIRQAGAATAAGTRGAHDALGSGASDFEATMAATAAMEKAGSGMLTDGPFVVTGAGSALAHARGSTRHANRGDLASTMMTASIGRYQCPLERSFPVGEGAARVLDLIDLTATATRHVMDNLGPGMTAHDGDRIARDFWTARGLEASFVHRLAYSIGVAYPPLWWENDVMQLRQRDTRTVRVGMTFHLVPGIHVDGLGFINQSMPVIITETGCEPLSDLDLVIGPA